MRLQNTVVLGALVRIAYANVHCGGQGGKEGAKNFIYIVPDGYGVASQTLARDYAALVNGGSTIDRPMSPAIGADHLVIGSVRTQSSDALITDSAASATAFGCGIKTYNGAISVDDDHMPVGSVLEAAHLDGYKTGLIATSRITHATPACYASHALSRDLEDDIASQEIGYSHPLGSVVDLLMGGGRRHFLPEEQGGKRKDELDLVEWAQEKGFTYASDKEGLTDAVDGNGKVPLPFLGLFSMDHMSYELDRDDSEQPSLLEMTKVALASLGDAKDGEKGFFIMIEASRIDHAGHANDAAGHVHDTLMYNDVMDYVKQYIDDHPNTQMLSAADHECGGLTLEDNYNPPVIARATQTTEHVKALFSEYEGDDKAGYLKNELLPMLGLAEVGDDEVNLLLEAGKMDVAMGNLLALDAGINWSTDYHSAADVLLHGYATDRDGEHTTMKTLMGKNNDNTELPYYIAKVLDLDLDKTTKALRKDGVDWVPGLDQLENIKRAAKRHAHDHN